jgi:hypothetical protein
MKRTIRRAEGATLSVAAALVAFAAAGVAPVAAATIATADWSCANGQKYHAVYRRDRLVLNGDGVRYTLTPRRAASGVLYRGGGIRFHEKGRNAIMSFPGGGQVSCTRSALRRTGETQPPALGVLPAPGQSYGGVVRAGPSRSTPLVGTLNEGEPVTILADSGITWNGYHWFRIRYRGGNTGYQWGGILCSRGTLVPGIFRTCP